MVVMVDVFTKPSPRLLVHTKHVHHGFDGPIEYPSA